MANNVYMYPVPRVSDPPLCGITPVAFGYGINSANRYYCTALVISEFH